MAGYKLTIKNASETIELSTAEDKGSADIISVKFKMNTLDNNTKNRADAIRAEIEIKGEITEDNKDKTKSVVKWAMDADKKTLYRDISLVVYEGKNCTGGIIRRYDINTMFVIDYEEDFTSSSGNSEIGKYTLFIAQKEGYEDKEVFSS